MIESTMQSAAEGVMLHEENVSAKQCEAEENARVS